MSIGKHIEDVNSPSTNFIRNLSQGRVVDKSRVTLQEKIKDQFVKPKKVVYNYNNVQNDISNFISDYSQGIRHDNI